MILIIATLFTLTVIVFIAAILFPTAVYQHTGGIRGQSITAKDGMLNGRVQIAATTCLNGLKRTPEYVANSILQKPSIRAVTEQRLKRARCDEYFTAVEYTCVKIILVFVLISGNVGMHLLFRLLIPPQLLIPLAGVAFMVPDYILEQRAARFDARVTQELPQVIDMLLICAESGMGLINAIGVVAEKKGGLIGYELRMCLQEINLGIRIQEALNNLTRRNKSRELQLFVNSINQALRMGTPIQNILRNLSSGIRERERQRLENRIGSIPMKLTVVTMIFFMPLVFIIVLFPSLLSFMQSGW